LSFRPSITWHYLSRGVLQRIAIGTILGTVLFSGVPFRIFADRPNAAHAQAGICDEPVRRFRGGHGRRPGATTVVVTLRQQVLDVYGGFISSSTNRNLSLLAGDEVSVRVQVNNNSIYDVSHVVMRHRYRPATGGPRMDGIASVLGAAYDPSRDSFIIDRIKSDETAEFSFRILLHGNLGSGISETEMTLEDFMVLESERRLPPRTGLTPDTRLASTQRIERVGLGGTEVSCFTGAREETFSAVPSRTSRTTLERVTRTPQQPVSAVVVPSGALTIDKRASRQEAMLGDRVTYTIAVQNQSAQTFRNILVDDRFDTAMLQVENAGGALVTDVGLHWLIASLKPTEQWTARYIARIAAVSPAQQGIPNTVTLIGEQLIDVPVSDVSDSVEVRIGQSVLMPQTGWDTFAFAWTMLQFLLGAFIAFGLYGVCMWEVWRRIR
jgi:uncharacterized repeat protein (TIGR01451 family)